MFCNNSITPEQWLVKNGNAFNLSMYLSETQREKTAERTAVLSHHKCPQHHSMMSGTGQTVQIELKGEKQKKCHNIS